MSLRGESEAALDAATPEELAAYAGPALERLPRGWLPPKAFMPIRERVRFSTIDVVAFLAGTNAERVLIGHRGAQPGDRWWSGMINLPGSGVLPTAELEPLELRMADGRLVELGNARVSQDITTPTDCILGKELKDSIRRVAPVTELMRFWVDDDPISISENKITVCTVVDLAPGYDEVVGGAFYGTQDIIAHPPEQLVNGHEYFIELGLLAFRGNQ